MQVAGQWARSYFPPMEKELRLTWHRQSALFRTVNTRKTQLELRGSCRELPRDNRFLSEERCVTAALGRLLALQALGFTGH